MLHQRPWCSVNHGQSANDRAVGVAVDRQDDAPALGEEAAAQHLQTRVPWVWMVVGLLLVVGFIGTLMVAGPSRLASMPTQSAIFSAPERHR